MANVLRPPLAGQLLTLIAAVLCYVAALRTAAAQFPVPRRYDGFLYGREAAKDAVVVEAFVDLMCPNCRDSWPTLKSVVEHYGDDKINVIVHPFANPFHHYSFYAARGMHAAAALNASTAVAWMEAVFERQENFDNNATALETPASTLARFSDVASKIGLSGTSFLHAYDREDVDVAARVSFKYGCARNVVWTPSHLVNGAPLGPTSDWSLDDWKRLLDPLFDEGHTHGLTLTAIM